MMGTPMGDLTSPCPAVASSSDVVLPYQPRQPGGGFSAAEAVRAPAGRERR